MAPKVVMTMADWRLDVLLEPERTGRSVKEVCERHEIARSTFYVWRARFEVAGLAGLVEGSKEPITQPRRIDPRLEQLICTLRRDNPRWGAKTIRARLRRMGVATPATSTIHRTLVRNGLVVGEPRKRPKALLRRFERDEPNDLWQMDATEEHLADGTTVEIVDVLDDHARFLLATEIASHSSAEATWGCFQKAAMTYGLPRQVLTDNHLSFTGRLHGKVVNFERRIRAAGVQLINCAPGHPQTQGKIERFHKTLHEWLADRPRARDVVELERLLVRFQDFYNRHRPHQSLEDLTPAERYRPSALSFDKDLLDDPVYPADAIVRRVAHNGVINFAYLKISVGQEWGRRLIRIVPDGDRLAIYFGDTLVRELVPDRSQAFQALPRRRRAT